MAQCCNKYTSLNYKWTIENFGAVPWTAPKESEPFTFGPEDTLWCLKLTYHHDESMLVKDKIYLELRKLSNVSNATSVKLNVSVLDESTSHISSIEVVLFGNDDYKTYSQETPAHSVHLLYGGYPESTGRNYEYVREPIIDRYLHHINTTLICKLTIQEPVRDDLGLLLWKNEKLADVTLWSKGKEFKAHKLVLNAKSAMFSAMFEHQMQEKSNNRVEIDDVEPDILGEMLHWIYTGQSPNMATLAPELLTAADKYELEGLKTICEAHIGSNLTVEKAVSLLILADRHSIIWLKSKVAHFIFVNFEKVQETEDWQDLVKNHTILAVDVLKCKLKK